MFIEQNMLLPSYSHDRRQYTLRQMFCDHLIIRTKIDYWESRGGSSMKTAVKGESPTVCDPDLLMHLSTYNREGSAPFKLFAQGASVTHLNPKVGPQ